MAKKNVVVKSKTPLEQYTHADKERLNNPPVGLVTPSTDGLVAEKKYEYDPHLDPQLVWAGKAEHTSFTIPTVSLHVHEKIDPKTIIDGIRNGKEEQHPSLFESDKKPLREAVEFYKHKDNWTNRLVAGDSLLVMNSLLEKEGMAGKVQMIYFDPPYGIKYGSNFQPFVNKRDVRDGKDEDLSSEPEMIKAFRDTWELGIHSYLSYLRDRLLLARELLSDSGSIFVQISDENVHLVRSLLDEVFGKENFVSLISFTSTSGIPGLTLSRAGDYILWYAKDKISIKYRQLYFEKMSEVAHYNLVQEKNGRIRNITMEEKNNLNKLPSGSKLCTSQSLSSQSETKSDNSVLIEGKHYIPQSGQHWKTTVEGIGNLYKKGRILITKNSLRYLRFKEDFLVTPINNMWNDTVIGSQEKTFVVQTSEKNLSRCILLSTDTGDLVLDITCGSGTTAYVAEQWGRRWITCDTSRISLTLAKQRLMTAVFDYYKLARYDDGVAGGLQYKTVPHITLKSLANNEPPGEETLYDQPFIDTKRLRVTGPFTVEAVPAPMAKSIEEIERTLTHEADISISRKGETLRQTEWRDELLKTGIRAKAGKKIEFSRVEQMAGTRYIQAVAETKEDIPKRVFISFGSEFAPLEQKQVELALEEAEHLRPKPDILVFAAFEFDPEAAKDIDETNWPGITLLKVQMNADLFTHDLKKKRTGNDSYWLIGQPDVKVIYLENEPVIARSGTTKQSQKANSNNDKVRVEVMGFDYYNPKSGTVDSGGKNNIAMWMLDTDYDGRSLFPTQIFFPMAGVKEGWSKLGKNLKAEIDEEKLEAFGGTVSIPFEPGKRIAVKIIDDRGIESLRIIDIKKNKD
ncbi:MAG: site-specific DNA-methyltransferase [bacterium]